MSSYPLMERLEQLECHFTWGFEDCGPVHTGHLLPALAIRIKHTPYRNQATFYAMRAYLHQKEGKYQDALKSLQEAEKILKDSHLENFDRSVLVTYGNYAWIYYHLCDYDKVEEYLDKITDIYKSLNPPTEPYSLIHEINAAEGWSLLARSYTNGELAVDSFEEALAEDPQNRELHAGLAIALYAAASDSSVGSEMRRKAKAKIQEVAYEDPINYEVRACLIQLLSNTNPSEAYELAEDTVHNSRNPDILRKVSHLYMPNDLNRQLEILKMAICLDDTYYLLYRDLGVHYQKQLQIDKNFKDPAILSEAIQAFKKAIELVPNDVFAKLYLAEIYGMNKQLDFQKEMYTSLEADLPNLTRKCQQAFYLSYGKFHLYQKNALHEAAQLFLKGFKLSVRMSEEEQCRRQLSKIVGWLEREDKTAEAAKISNILQQSDQTEH